MKAVLVLSVMLVAARASADATEDLQMCHARETVAQDRERLLINQLVIVREIRDYFEARLAEALARLDLEMARSKMIPPPASSIPVPEPK